MKGADRRAGRRGDCWVERVHVEAQVDRAVAAWAQVVDRLFEDVPDPELVDLIHRERLDLLVPDGVLLTGVDVAQAYVYDVLGLEHGLDPVELRHGLAEPEEEGEGHAVYVPCTGVGIRPLAQKSDRTVRTSTQYLPVFVVSGVLMSP